MGTEPVGALKPKISTIDVTRVVPTDRGFALLCPAQAFPNRLEPPSPSSHRVTKVAPLKTSSPRVSPSCVRPKHIPCLSLEPVGSTKPKISGEKIRTVEETVYGSVTLSPWVLQSPKYLEIRSKDWKALVEVTSLCCVRLKHFPCLSIEPVGSKAPKFSSDLKLSMFERHAGQSFALLCSAQGYPVPFFRTCWFERSQIFFGRQILNVREGGGT
ncbi:hypothetical protein M8J75_000679 [Diaphorina citri]|nr:hypothetical protein M8J75_000679 [Diaphorina citri]